MHFYNMSIYRFIYKFITFLPNMREMILFYFKITCAFDISLFVFTIIWAVIHFFKVNYISSMLRDDFYSF